MPSSPLRSWIAGADDSDFPLAHCPLGIRQRPDGSHAVVSRVGDQVIDLRVLAEIGVFDDTGASKDDFRQNGLNQLIGRGKQVTGAVRTRLQACLDDDPGYWDLRSKASDFCLPAKQAKLVLPVQIGDYTDFYSSIEHATNVGTMFRDPDNALLPNWRHLPVGYHGRASSITVSGTPIHRPIGQTTPGEDGVPGFGESRLLDFELEMAFVVGKGNPLGEAVPVAEAEDHIFGVALFNDWSARDIQKWEYVPLGPFLGKSFASTISPWITPLEALEPVRITSPEQSPQPLPYLRHPAKSNFDISLEVYITPENGVPTKVCDSNTKYLYWSMAQQLAHHTVNGCNLRPGDVCASGTISGPTPDSYGSMLELSWRGTKPLTLEDGSERKFIQDGDTVTMRAYVNGGGVKFALGEASAKVQQRSA